MSRIVRDICCVSISLKKQQGVVDRLAEDRPPPSGRTLLGTKSGGAVELFPVLAVKRGQGALVSLSFAPPDGSAMDNAQVQDLCLYNDA